MHRNSILLFAAAILLFSFASSDEPSMDKKWKPLFNGKDLDGWKMKIVGFPLGENFGNTFRVENGILSIRYDQYGDNFNNRFGALYHNKKFKNYRLRAEYRFVGETAPGAPTWGFKDGGVMYHCQDPLTLALTQPFPVCLEYNLHGGNGKEERPTGEICTPGTKVDINGKPNESFCTLPTVRKTFDGEEWVTLEVEVKNGKIKHFVNGQEILQCENPRYDANHEQGKKLINGADASIQSGFISLQSNSHPMDFRKIEIMEY